MYRYFPVITPDLKKLPFFVTGIGSKHNQRDIERKEGFNLHQISICTDGEGIFSSGEKSYKIKKGDCFFFRAKVPHEYYSLTKPWSIKWISFDGNSLGSLLDYLDFEDYLVLSLSNFKKVENNIDEISKILSQNETDKNIICSSLLYSLLIKLSEAKKRSTIGILSHIRERIKPVIAFMEENYTKDIPLKELAEIIDVSPNFLCRLFKEAYSTSPIKYLISIRLQKAKFFLSESSSVLIKDVADMVGFRDASYFCSVFKKNEGISPADFQKAHYINK